jgi:hypothetical protein
LLALELAVLLRQCHALAGALVPDVPVLGDAEREELLGLVDILLRLKAEDSTYVRSAS